MVASRDMIHYSSARGYGKTRRRQGIGTGSHKLILKGSDLAPLVMKGSLASNHNLMLFMQSTLQEGDPLNIFIDEMLLHPTHTLVSLNADLVSFSGFELCLRTSIPHALIANSSPKPLEKQSNSCWYSHRTRNEHEPNCSCDQTGDCSIFKPKRPSMHL